jgi:hypothetical protein
LLGFVACTLPGAASAFLNEIMSKMGGKDKEKRHLYKFPSKNYLVLPIVTSYPKQ